MVAGNDRHPILAAAAHAITNTDQYAYRDTSQHTESPAGRAMGDVSTGSLSTHVNAWPVTRCNHDVTFSHPKVNSSLGLRGATAHCLRQYLNCSV